MNIPARDVPVNRFFSTTDEPPGNVWCMRVAPCITGNETGLCQNVHDESYWEIEGHVLVRLIREDEHDKIRFVV